MRQDIALHHPGNGLSARQQAPEADYAPDPEIARQTLEAAALGTLADQPVLSPAAVLDEAGEGAQAEVESFEVQKTSDAGDAQTVASADGPACEVSKILIVHACFGEDADVGAAKRAQASSGVFRSRERNSGAPRGQCHERIGAAERASNGPAPLVDSSTNAEAGMKRARRRFPAAYRPPEEGHVEKSHEAGHPVLHEGHVLCEIEGNALCQTARRQPGARSEEHTS